MTKGELLRILKDVPLHAEIYGWSKDLINPHVPERIGTVSVSIEKPEKEDIMIHINVDLVT